MHVMHCGGGTSLGESLGITTEEIKNIVYGFYAKVREDALLGPVFESEMKESWDNHLPKMCDFWETIMFSRPRYHGNPLAAHAAVSGINAHHFDRWLELFDQTLQEVCPNAEHVSAFNGKAQSMRAAMTNALGLRMNMGSPDK